MQKLKILNCSSLEDSFIYDQQYFVLLELWVCCAHWIILIESYFVIFFCFMLLFNARVMFCIFNNNVNVLKLFLCNIFHSCLWNDFCVLKCLATKYYASQLEFYAMSKKNCLTKTILIILNSFILLSNLVADIFLYILYLFVKNVFPQFLQFQNVEYNEYYYEFVCVHAVFYCLSVIYHVSIFYSILIYSFTDLVLQECLV